MPITYNPLVDSVHHKDVLLPNFDLKIRKDQLRKISFVLRTYESVDDKSLS